MLTAGKSKLALGRVTVTSTITRESGPFSFGVLHMGDHNVSGNVRPLPSPEEYEATNLEIVAAFERGDLTELIGAVGRAYPSGTYTLNLLFRDEQIKILRLVLGTTLA